MKSLRELEIELLGVRLSAANNSLWQLAGSLSEAARTAFNEAIRTYQFTARRTYTSFAIPDAAPLPVVLPEDCQGIIAVRAIGPSGPTEVTGWEYAPTNDTKLLMIRPSRWGGTPGEVQYETRVLELPPKMVLGANLTSLGGAIVASGGVPIAQFRAPGLLEIASQTNTTRRELIFFNSVTQTGFEAIVRNWGGVRSMQTNWSKGDILSAVLEVDDRALPVVMHAAQAEMYSYWVRHHAQYTQYIANAGDSAVTLEDLMALVRAEEMRADRRYGRVRTAPEIATVATKRRRR